MIIHYSEGPSFTFPLPKVIDDEASVYDTLDFAYSCLNRGSGEECFGLNGIPANIRSMSVGDVIEHHGDFYFCDNIGWTQISSQQFKDWKKLPWKETNGGFEYLAESGQIWLSKPE